MNDLSMPAYPWVRRADEVLENALLFLEEVEAAGLFESIEKGLFADIKRFKSGGKGYDGVVTKQADYWNPVEDYLNQNLTGLLRVSNPKSSEVSLFDEVRKFMEYPKYIPAFKSFSLMENGWLYIVVDTIENEYVLIDLFDEQGIYIGQFNSNIPTSDLTFKNGKAFGVATVGDYKYVKIYSYEIQVY